MATYTQIKDVVISPAVVKPTGIVFIAFAALDKAGVLVTGGTGTAKVYDPHSMKQVGSTLSLTYNSSTGKYEGGFQMTNTYGVGEFKVELLILNTDTQSAWASFRVDGT